jgi:hypothetical protein
VIILFAVTGAITNLQSWPQLTPSKIPMPFGTGRLFLVWSLALAYHYQAAFTKPRNIGPFFFSIYGIGFECKAKDIDPKSLHKGPLIERTWNGVI